MSIELAIRLTEIILGIALIQQSIEHLTRFNDERVIFAIRILFSILLVIGFKSNLVVYVLLVLSVIILHHFDGPYNGGADRMGLLILLSLGLYHAAPTHYWQEIAFGYLALQLIFSYFISGWVKLKNSEWRNGQALVDVFRFSVYPVSESLRNWSNSPVILFYMSWTVILFELIFPFSLLTNVTLFIALAIAACFHLANACLFGLNRFLWIWLAAYPSLVWFQQRIAITI